MGHHPECLVILFVPPGLDGGNLSCALTRDPFDLVWKRDKDTLYLGSVHGGELPEMYGITGDHLGTDAIGTPIVPPLSYTILAIN